MPPSRVTIVEGFFEDTLRPERRGSIPLEQVAIAWVDCDLYASTVPVLDYLADRLPDGAVIVFDDWYHFKARPDRGQQLACSEWLVARPDLRLRQFHRAG